MPLERLAVISTQQLSNLVVTPSTINHIVRYTLALFHWGFLPSQCSVGTRHNDLFHEHRGPGFLRTHWPGPKLWV